MTIAAETPTTDAPLRITLCLSYYRPVESGAERQAHRQAVELVRRGHTVRVLTRSLPGVPVQQTEDGVDIHRVIRPRELGPLFGLTFTTTLIRALHRWRSETDVVHCHQALFEAVASGWFAARTGMPTLVQPAAGGEFGDVTILERTRGRRILRKLVLRNSQFVAISRQIEEELRRFGVPDSRLLRLASGVDVDEFSPGTSLVASQLPAGPRALFLGRLHPQKNLPCLLDAWRCVVAIVPDAVLLLAGDGPLRDELERQAAELGIAESVRFLGAVGQPVEYLRAADVFVLPSHSEGMSNSLLEAMACAVPPIVSNAGGNVDLVEPGVTGMVVDAASSERLASALADLLSAPAAERRRIGAAARQRIVRDYSLAAIVDRYEALYRELVARRQP